MHDLPRQKLRELLVQYGRSLCDDPRRCEALLKDYCGQYKREIFVLISALKNRVAEDLINASAGVPLTLVMGRLSQRLKDELGLAEDAARWAVESWALALGLSVATVDRPQPTPEPSRVQPVELPRRPVVPPTSASLSLKQKFLKLWKSDYVAPPTRLPQKPFTVFRDWLRPMAVIQSSATRTLKPLTVFRDRLRWGSEGPAMIVIPAGEFWMGSPESEEGRFDNERRHWVKIERSFAIGQYAVTFDEYDQFCTAAQRHKPEDQGWGRGNQPVINVSWHDAVDYTEWLSAQTRQVYRLPTEAEWEYAVRAETETVFWWGDNITTEQANYDGNYTYCSGKKGIYRKKTVPVDQFQPNPWGLYQVHGNVFEWTGSCYDKNYEGMERLYAGENKGGVRTLRGGSWLNHPVEVRSANRNWDASLNRFDGVGFRLARSL
ncbi:MAG: formylglycine-generating enzyme family protein [Candidatus Competibacteraceae bacterium]